MLPFQDESASGGVNVPELIRLVENGIMPAPRMIYIIPIHQNPTGITMPIHDRLLLSQFVAKHNILLVADEVYHLLDWRDSNHPPRPARMAAFNVLSPQHASIDKPSRSSGGCVSVSSFTKIFAPGIRCGWIEAPDYIISSLERHGYIRSQGGCAPFIGSLMLSVIKSGTLDRYLDTLRTTYSRRLNVLCNILKDEPRIQIHHTPCGGYFLWIYFPTNISSENFLNFCLTDKYLVRFLPGNQCDPFHSTAPTGNLESSARLCFAYLNEEDLIEGATRFVTAFRDYTGNREKFDA